MMPEKSVRTATHNQMKRLTIISDAALAIKLCHEALTTSIMSSSVLQRAVQVESNLTPILNQLRNSLPFFLQLIILHQRSHHGISDVWREANNSADLMAKSHAREVALNKLPLAERHSRNTTSHAIRNEIGLASVVGRLEVDLPCQGDNLAAAGPPSPPLAAAGPPLPPLPPPAPVLTRPPLPALALCLSTQGS